MKILLAWPWTGKTTKIKEFLEEKWDISKCLIISFTNATVNDLQKSLSSIWVSGKNCMSLHKFAIKFNHDRERHILIQQEIEILKQVSKMVWVEFDTLCNLLNSTTFWQMIDRFSDFAKTNPLYLKKLLSWFNTLIVDEYQDFNSSEQKLIDLLINTIEDSIILWDDDQCIYDFKDADADKIISFYENTSNDKLEHENKCYRCPDCVVEHSTNLILNNKKRVNKKWEKTGKDGEIIYKQLMNFDDVDLFIINEIENIFKITPQANIMILTPVWFAIKSMVDILSEKWIKYKNHFFDKIPFEIIWKSWELKSIFWNHKYLNLLFLWYYLLDNRKNFYNLLKKHFDNGMNYDELFLLLNKKIPKELLIKFEDIEDFFKEDRYMIIKDLFENSNWDSIEEKLENIIRNEEISNDEENFIDIMSIYKSKWLWADIVFIVWLIEWILPNKKIWLDSIEFQRRLLFVWMTRAKKKLYLLSNINVPWRYVNTVNKNDFKYNFKTKQYLGKSSSFISELKI